MSAAGTNQIGLRLIPFYIVSFVVLGAFLPYWPLWLEDRGATKTDIGWIMSAGVWVRVAAPWVAQWIDERAVQRRAMVWLLIASTLSFALFHWTHGFVPLFVLSLAFGAGWMMIYPLVDTLAAAVSRGHYGRLRLWGSASFMVTSLAVGAMLEVTPITAVYWVVLGALGLSVVSSLTLPDPNGAPGHAAPAQPGLRPLPTLVRDRTFLLMALGTGLVQGSHAGLYAFGTIHWRSAGIGAPTIGALWAVGVIAEILLFLQGARIVNALGPTKLAAIGGIGAILRWSTLASTTSLVPLFAMQTFHALTFGATHLAIVSYIAQRVPGQLGVTAQTIYTAVGMGIVMGSATVVSGPLIEAYGGAMFWLMAGIAAAGLALIAAVRRDFD